MREFFFFTIKRACPTNKINLDQTTENTEDFFVRFSYRYQNRENKKQQLQQQTYVNLVLFLL